jgi:hypothetical protein
MGALGFVQLIVDVLFLFLLMVLLVGRVWRRGAAANEEHASYREMIASLTALIREMKETAAELEEISARKQLELQRAVGAADDRLELLRAAVSAPPAALEPPPPGGGRRAAEPGAPAPAARATGPQRGAEPLPDDEDERREKYRVALDFARKGWSTLEIARHTQLPRGEIELLIKTRGGQAGGGG